MRRRRRPNAFIFRLEELVLAACRHYEDGLFGAGVVPTIGASKGFVVLVAKE